MTIMKFLRIEKGLTATDAAKEFDVSSMTIANIEGGRKPRRKALVKKLEAFYGRPLDILRSPAVLA